MIRNKILLAVVAVLAVFAVYSLITINRLNTKLSRLNAEKEKEIGARLNKEREVIRKDIQEKYNADMVSYEAMAKRLEIEKNKALELEEQLKTSQKPVKKTKKK